MLPAFFIIFLIKNAHSSYAKNCLQQVPPTELLLKQSFPIETIQYPLSRNHFEPRSLNEFTIGSGVINEQVHYKNNKFIKPWISISTGQQITETELVNGDNFVQKAMRNRTRYEWKCPAGFYSIPTVPEVSINTPEAANYQMLNITILPVNHNYFVNMQLNQDITVYAGYGAIVIHSVNLNRFTLTLKLKFFYSHVVQGARSIPMIQITNNYGPGNIIIEYQEKLGDTLSIRDVVHGGNEKDVKIQINQMSGDQRKFDVELVDFTKPVKQYAEPQPKSADIDEEDDEQIGEEFFEDGPSTTGDFSFVLLILGLVFFVLAIAMFITPFIIPKDNNFELLELYEYYADIDEL